MSGAEVAGEGDATADADAAGDADEASGADARHVDALRTPLEHAPLPAAEVDVGTPTTALAELGSFAGLDYGIWEMTTGTARDVEADELFVVLAGRGTVEFLDADDVPAPVPGAVDVALDARAPRILSLEPGSLVRLHAGERTRWTITETLRKVWLAPGDDIAQPATAQSAAG